MSYASLGRVDPDCYRSCKEQNPPMVLVNGQQVPEHTYCANQCNTETGTAVPSVPSSTVDKKTLLIAAGAAVVVIGVGIFVIRKKR